jgi:hypothetical protein
MKHSVLSRRFAATFAASLVAAPVGTAEEALDCACGLYLNDPTAWHTN